MVENHAGGPLTETVLYVLLALHESMHGYGIMQCAGEMSHGRVTIGPGTLYGALTTLVEKGWIVPLDNDAGDRKKQYVITDTGRVVVRAELARIEELLETGRRIAGRDRS
jgi:DNA-binding PadR family transcriptional regulator